MGSHVVLLNLDAELVQHANADKGTLPVTLQALAGRRGWSSEVKQALALLVVGGHADAGLWVEELRATPGGSGTPVLCVMDKVEPAWVPALRQAGVVRIMMRDEFGMDAGTILRAVS
jgi:hypothetical protein